MPLYAFTIALSAFLLFLVQPIMARQILPWFGGSAAVWTTCMMFFQLVLLGGYAYSDFLTRRLDVPLQRRVHGTLLVGSLVLLPIVVGEQWRPSSPDAPVLQIVLLLAGCIGLPYFMLSTTGPLLQAWFAGRFPQARVYRLYALSNAASMTALIAYPPLIEPIATLTAQAFSWSAGYLVFVLAGIFLLSRIRQEDSRKSGAATVQGDSASGDEKPKPLPSPAPFTWFGYSALSSVLLLSVTAHLTQNVASVPFLWLLPLSLYLLSFILCFDGRGWYRPKLFLVLAGLSCALMCAGLFVHVGTDGRVALGGMPVVQGVLVYAAGLFLLCMFLHGELAARRPPAATLTRFYLLIAAGGATGSVLVAILAGLLFDRYLELPLALLACAAVLLYRAPTECLRVVAFLVAATTFTGVAMYTLYRSPSTIENRRNFYGVLSVIEVAGDAPGRGIVRLSHGNTVHGEQFLDGERRLLPGSYYGFGSGVSRALRWLQEQPGAIAGKVGVIGLGTGTLAAYGRRGDLFRFYEIDPMVETLARKHFTFLADGQASSSVILGDGRLMLEREASNGFGLLVIDAFSSDAIPMHLLTNEAMAVYLRHVEHGGAIAFHVSNRYLDLRPVVQNLAHAVQWRAVVFHDKPDIAHSWLKPSTWVIVTGSEQFSEAMISQGGREVAPDPSVKPWTDAYGNLLSVVSALRRGAD